VSEASTGAVPGTMRAEFSWTEEEAERGMKYATLANELLTDMHEVIGHASGQQASGKARNPQEVIKEYFSALEEGRADLVGLYFIADPKLAELGILPAAEQDAIVRAAFESYARGALTQLRRVREGTQLEEDHMRNQQMVVSWLMANTKAIEMRRRDNRTYYVVVDPKAFREGAGRLLAEVQRIKSEADYRAARTLFDMHGIHFDPKLRDEVAARVDKLKLPSYIGFVMPTLTPVMGPDGAISDVTISYPMDLKAQMLEFAGLR
jgi:dipeptidyl-peptidase-3